MIAAFALILLADAPSPCPQAGPIQLAGGATIVRPVGKAGPLPFELLGPTTGLNKPDEIHRTGADNDGEEPDICKVTASQIV